MTTKPLAEQSPSEIDVQLAALYEAEQKALSGVAMAQSSVYYAAGAKRVYLSRGTTWSMKFSEAVDKVEALLDSDKPWVVRESQETLARLDAANAKVSEIRAQAEVFNAEFTRRGGWTRAFLAKSTNGHVHNGMDCSTCNKMGQPTQFGWFPEYSGKPEAEIVADAGERACTTCYPSAPVSVLSRPTKFFTEDEKAKAKAREERAEKKAKADAEKIEVEGIAEYSSRTQTKVFKSLRAATQFASSQRADVLTWGGNHPSCDRWNMNAYLVEQAIAAKTGQPYTEVHADIVKRAAATAKRRG